MATSSPCPLTGSFSGNGTQEGIFPSLTGPFGLSFNAPQASPNSAGQIMSYDCRVCSDQYTVEGDRVPRLLSCGHSVCHQCLTRLHFEGQRHDAIYCPFDRSPSSLPVEGVPGLKKNFALIELLEKCASASEYKEYTKESSMDAVTLNQQQQLAITCDENQRHIAVVYCLRCETNLCLSCAEMTHRGNTLSKHHRVPLSEKPTRKPNCQTHPQHVAEFICLNLGCQASPLMCYICKEYGRHNKHSSALFDDHVKEIRTTLSTASQIATAFTSAAGSLVREINSTIQHIVSDESTDPAGRSRTTSHLAGVGTRAHFARLRQTIDQQEAAALSRIDAYVAERVGALCAQRNDISSILSQISEAYSLCQQILSQDEQRLVGAYEDATSLLSMLRHQQHLLTEMPDLINLDPAIPITFTKDNRVHIGPKMEMRVIQLGLDDSGKTSILFRLKQNEFIESTPTIGFNVEPVEYKNIRLTVWDVGGLPKLRPLWKHYFYNTQALIYVVDSSNSSRLEEAKTELVKLVQEKDLRDTAILLLANKMDKDTHMEVQHLTEKLNLDKLCSGRSWHIQACDAKTGTGLADGLEWLSKQIIATGIV